MCGLLDLLKSAATPRATQKQHGSVPKPDNAVSNASTGDNSAAQKTSKVPQYMFEAILDFLDQEIQTSNPKRRASIQICRDFVSEYGFPEEDHYIHVKDGVARVLTEEERSRLPRSPAKVNNFLLAAPEWEIHCQ